MVCELRDSNRHVTVAHRLLPREIPLCFVWSISTPSIMGKANRGQGEANIN